MSNPFSSLDLIPALVAVIETGSLSAAARALGLSQPTVRRHIEALEAELNLTLFTRSGNGLLPTEVAYRLLPVAEAVLSEARALRRMASGATETLSGSVRLTCSRVLAVHVLPPLLVDLARSAPDLSIELDASDETQNLLTREADVAIRFAPPRQQALVARKLPAVEIGLYARTDQENPTLDSFPFIADDAENRLLPTLEAMGLPTPTRIAARTDDALAQIALISAGAGAGVCQTGIAERLGLTRLSPHVRYDMPTWIVMHEDQAQIRRVRFVFDALVGALPGLLCAP